MTKHKIFIACDTNNKKEIKKIIAQTKTNALDINYKFGLEFFMQKVVVILLPNSKIRKFF